MSALVDFETDLERAFGALKAAVGDAVESLDCAYTLFEDCEQDPKNPDRISIAMRSLEVLKREQEDAEAAVATALKDYAWELKRALRAYQQTLVRESAS
jgi:hypothetical protein